MGGGYPLGDLSLDFTPSPPPSPTVDDMHPVCCIIGIMGTAIRDYANPQGWAVSVGNRSRNMNSFNVMRQ